MYTDIQRIGELSNDGVFVFDLKAKKFNYVNDILASIFRISKDQLIQQPSHLLPLVRSEDTTYLQHRLSELQQHRSISNTEFRLHFDDGTVRHLSCDAYVIQPGTVVGFVKDFSKEKEHENYIVNYGAKKDTLLDMMAHNLSGPLNLTQNILRWIRDHYKESADANIGAQLELIQDNTRHCLDIVNDFLRQEHLESERIYVKKTRFDVLERILATLEKLIATNLNKTFRLITELESLNITTDSVKFFQIIHNLVSNAIKFTPDQGQIDIIVEETKDSFIVRVRDNGIGIPAHLHQKLFERRTLAARNGLKNEASTGMGLSIVKILTELLGGRVSFESNENKGSVFSIELPKE